MSESRGFKKPDGGFDFRAYEHAVFSALTPGAQQRTSVENVAGVLDALTTVWNSKNAKAKTLETTALGGTSDD